MLFEGLNERAELINNEKLRKAQREKEVNILFYKIVQNHLEELNSLGFPKIVFYGTESTGYFYLNIQTGPYSSSDFTHNLQIGTLDNFIYYGYGANGIKGDKIGFDPNWNDSKLVGMMQDALRALVKKALVNLKFHNSNK